MAAIRAAGDLGIAVALVQWSGPRLQRTSIDWTHLRDDAGAAGLAKAIEASKRQLRGDTSLGGAIRFSLGRISKEPDVETTLDRLATAVTQLERVAPATI